MRRNPFVIKDAVPPDKFFDRDEILSDFRRALDRGTRDFLWAFVAPLRFGKTSILLKLAAIADEYPDIIPVFLNCSEPLPVKRTLANLCSSLTKKFRVEREQVNVLWREYTRLVESRLYTLSEFFDKIWDVLESVDAHLMLFLDEFQELPEPLRQEVPSLQGLSDEQVFKVLRAVFGSPRARVGLVVSGSVIGKLLDALDVWNGRFLEFHLGPFDKESAIAMMRALFREGGLDVPDDVIEQIVEMCGAHPYYLQLMGHQIYELGSWDHESINLARERVWDAIFHYFYRLYSAVRARGSDYIKLLHMAARDELTYDVVAGFSDRLYLKLQELVRMGVIRMGERSYEIPDPLFKRYVQTIPTFGERPPSSIIICTDAEQEVAFAVHREGFAVLHVRYSRGPFDIYACPRDEKGIPRTTELVGIQVKFRSADVLYLREEEIRKILEAQKKYGVIPVIAFVRGRGLINFFAEVKTKYVFGEGSPSLRECLIKRGIKL